MSLIQVIILIIVLIVWWRLYGRLKSGEMNVREFLEWFALWFAAAVLVLVPEVASYLASLVGVGRGSDLVTYFALLLVFYLVFKVFVKLERAERELTRVVRELALRSSAQGNTKSANEHSFKPPAA